MGKRKSQSHSSTDYHTEWISGTGALTRSVKMLGRARRGWSIAVAAVDGGVDGALAGGPVDHPVPSILVALEREYGKAGVSDIHSR